MLLRIGLGLVGRHELLCCAVVEFIFLKQGLKEPGLFLAAACIALSAIVAFAILRPDLGYESDGISGQS